MTADKISHIQTYLSKVKAANKESIRKELFKDLLHRLYGDKQDVAATIDSISAGAEYAILNIPRLDRIHRGSADTLYNDVIIEFEANLKTSLKHAKEQLAGYMLGMYRQGQGYGYTLIATDCISWQVFSPDIDQLPRLHTLQENELILHEVPDASITLTDANAEDFYYWIDRFLFKTVKQKATLKRVAEDFGHHSATFVSSYNTILSVFQDAKKYGEVQVSYDQWSKFLSIAYGSFIDTDEAFVIHTYLSILAKVIAYEVLTDRDFVADEAMMGILTGDVFHEHNIRNFVDNDFFHWVHRERYFHKLKPAFREIANALSRFDFTAVDEDILKGVYQELIDLDTRHALGEYYTPDWLCERVVQEFHFKPTDRILDPSCGSGSFLRAAIHRQRELNPHITIEQLCNSIYGIDIHPLSVQIAKTTVLLALGEGLKQLKQPQHLNIILANTLLAPDGAKELFGESFRMEIDKDKLILTSQILDDISLFDDGLWVCENMATATEGGKISTPVVLENMLHKIHANGGFTPQVIDSFHKIYVSFKKVKEMGRDSIWKFIVQNLYKPYFLAGKFDYIIGNPPWFTYSSIKNEVYQDTLNAIAERYEVKPARAKNYPHLEIAAIFLSYCNSYFLKENGQLAFVLPRSFFSGDQHDNTRSGTAKHLHLTQLWDMEEVAPLFNIPSCVFFSHKVGKGFPKGYTSKGIKGISFKARIPAHNSNWAEAKHKVVETEAKWYYHQQGNSSAFSQTKQKKKALPNPYSKLFKQGATIVPRTLYFVDQAMGYTEDWERDFDWTNRVIKFKTADHVKADAKAPWKEHKMSGLIESKFVFRTALSKNIMPFLLYKPDLVLLPLDIQVKGSSKEIKLNTHDVIYKDGYINAFKWFKSVELIWSNLRTEKNEVISSVDYLNWQNKLTSQNLNSKYIVIYTASAKDANATIVNRSKIDLEFIVESTAYAFYTDNLKEAHYLTAIINSSIPNLKMKDFQAKGLFGARHVHKKILDVYFPKYDGSNKTHLALADLGKTCHKKAEKYMETHAPTEELSGMRLGRLRVELKKHLSDEMNEIDVLVKEVMGR